MSHSKECENFELKIAANAGCDADNQNTESGILKPAKMSGYFDKAFDNLPDNQAQSGKAAAEVSQNPETILKNYRQIFLECKQKIDNKLLNSKNIKEFRHFLECDLKKEIIKTEKEIRRAFSKVRCKQCGKCCRLAVSEFDHKTLIGKAKNGDITAKSFLEAFEPYPENSLPDEVLGFYPALNLQACSQSRLQSTLLTNMQAAQQSDSQNILQTSRTDEACYFYRCNKVKALNGAYFCPIYSKRPAVCRNFPDTPLENLPKDCAYIPWKLANTQKALYIKASNAIIKYYIKTIQDMVKK